MKKLLKYLKPYWYLALLAPVFMVGEVVLDLMQPQLMENIVDKGILSEVLDVSEKTKVVVKYGIMMFSCLILSGVCGVLCSFFACSCANAFGDDLRKRAFSKVVDLSFEQKDKFTTGSLVTRITNDVTQVQEFVSMALRMLIRTIVMFIGGFIFMLLTSLTYAIILLIVLPIQAIVILFIIKKVRPYFLSIQTKVDKVNSVVLENVNGLRVVKAYTNEEKECSRFDEANLSLADTTLTVQKIMAWLHPISIFILNLLVILIIYFGGIEINNNIEVILLGEKEVLTVGKIMSSLTYVTMVFMAVIQLIFFTQFITRAGVSAKRINEILECSPVIVNNAKDSLLRIENTFISFDDVCFSYPNVSDVKVIKNFSLEIEENSSLCILGATGSGKSTLVNLIPRFYDVTSGSIKISNHDIRDFDLTYLRNNIAFVLQKTELFTGTILENILWGKNDATLDEVIEVSKIAQAHEFITSFEKGYETIVGEKGSTLSGGQKQRIAIARALLKKPKILIFDDSTSALDLLTESKLYQSLKENLKETSLILIAQRVASARNCNNICVIDDGKIASFGTHEELIESSLIYKDIYNSQLKRGEDNE